MIQAYRAHIINKTKQDTKRKKETADSVTVRNEQKQTQKQAKEMFNDVLRHSGIEPESTAWKAAILPLN